MSNKTVCIFAGAGGHESMFADNAWIATELVKSGWDIMYGGSSKGVMGAVCRAVKEAGGRIIGVLPEKIAALKHYDPAIEMRVADDMAQRKAHFWECDAFLCLPGSYGTMDELFEVLTLTKLGYISPARPIVIFDQDDFYTPIWDLIDNMYEKGFLSASRYDLLKFHRYPPAVVRTLNGAVLASKVGADE